jgi:hydrogenase maturation protease
MTASLRIGILGVGNILMGDDGVGPFVVKVLESRYEFPPNVALHDLGTPGLGITSFFADYDAIILVDAVSAKSPAGGIRLFRKPELVRTPIPHRFSPHDPALVEALLFAELSGKCPGEVLLVGIVPKTTELGCCLSEEVRSAVLPAITAVLAELRRLGVDPQPRATNTHPAIWWEEKQISNDALLEAEYVPGDSR